MSAYVVLAKLVVGDIKNFVITKWQISSSA